MLSTYVCICWLFVVFKYFQSCFNDNIIQQFQNGKKGKGYDEEVKSFAMTLNFYSGAAYKYVRGKFCKNLPGPSTIRKWYQSVNGSPGISKEAIKCIHAKVQEQKNNKKKIFVSLMFDEMAIRKQVQWNNSTNKFSGLIDLGNELIDRDSTVPATNALVYLVNSVNGYWKIPVAYYFVNSLTGREKASILVNVLNAIEDTGAEVISVTFDGAPANISMVSILGGIISSANNLKSYFPHPIHKKPVYVFLDVCHCLKLLRNTLGKQISVL